jgi:excisionase family DNA binding protein
VAKKNTDPIEPHYSVKEVAELLRVSRNTVLNYRGRGELCPWVCLAGRVLFPASTINKFLESRRVGAPPERKGEK